MNFFSIGEANLSVSLQALEHSMMSGLFLNITYLFSRGLQVNVLLILFKSRDHKIFVLITKSGTKGRQMGPSNLQAVCHLIHF